MHELNMLSSDYWRWLRGWEDEESTELHTSIRTVPSGTSRAHQTAPSIHITLHRKKLPLVLRVVQVMCTKALG